MSITPWAGPKVSPSPPARLVVSLLAGRDRPRQKALAMLVRRFGRLCFVSAPLEFNFTDYYRAEMGPGLTRRLAVFRELVDPVRLKVIKQVCMSIEQDLAAQGRRTVNLDPGLLAPDALVLATRKPRGHRVCLAPGIYAEVTLLYHKGDFQGLPWTYQDYAGPELKTLLHRVRRRYLWKRADTKGKEGSLD